jgi:hypothetical protein
MSLVPMKGRALHLRQSSQGSAKTGQKSREVATQNTRDAPERKQPPWHAQGAEATHDRACVNLSCFYRKCGRAVMFELAPVASQVSRLHSQWVPSASVPSSQPFPCLRCSTHNTMQPPAPHCSHAPCRPTPTAVAAAHLAPPPCSQPPLASCGHKSQYGVPAPPLPAHHLCAPRSCALDQHGLRRVPREHDRAPLEP